MVSFIASLRKIYIIFLAPNYLQMFGSKLETAQSPVTQALIWDSGTDVEAERKHKRAQWCTGFMVDPEMVEYQSDRRKDFYMELL